MSFDPVSKFWFSVAITVAIAISSGAVHLTDAVPAAWIPAVIAWSGIIAVIGSAVQTSLQGLGMSNASRAAAAQSLPADTKIAIAAASPEVSQIVTTEAIAAAAGPSGDGAKIVSKQ
jgi:hypothetical protein